MKRHLAAIAIILSLAGVVHAAKKYRLTIGDQTIVVELDEIAEPTPAPVPVPVPPPAPTPVPVPPPAPEPMPDHGIMVMPDAVMMGRESVPRFAAGAACVAVKSGSWSDPATWSKVPVEGEKVQIPEGVSVVYNAQSASKLDCIEVSGELSFSSEVDTLLWASEIMVLPAGKLLIKPGEHRAEIVFPDGPLRASDTGQCGRGLIVYGEIDVQGKELDKTFVRLAGDVGAGATKLQVREAVNWPVGSVVVLPDTRHINPTVIPRYYAYSPQWETRSVTGNQGDTLTLDAPLAFAHRGPRDMDGTPTKGLTPHVGCLSRSVVIRSEKPDGVRGHVQLIGPAKVSIRHAEFRDLGRTKSGTLNDANHIGRYSLHCHHLVGPKGGVGKHQFLLEGNCVRGGLKWGITVHDSHYGLIRGNVVYDIGGAGIATEIGSETGNLFDSNFVCRINGTPDSRSNGLGELTEGDLGDQGDGFWAPGPMNGYHNNVAANCYRSGYAVWPDGMPNLPTNRSVRPVQSPVSPLGDLVTKNLLEEAFDDFVGNEAYGATTSAVQLWSVGNRSLFPVGPLNTLKDTTAWHITGVGIRYYYADNYIVDGWLQRGDPGMIAKGITQGIYGYPSRGEAMTHSGSLARLSKACRVDIQGAEYGYIQRGHGMSSSVELCDAVLDNGQNIEIRNWAQHPCDSVYRNILFKDTYSPGAVRAIRMVWDAINPQIAVTPETHTVIDYQQIAGLNLDLYFHEQAPGVKASLVPEGALPAGRFAPVEQDGDKGEAAAARGKALGIDGLVFVTAHPDQPLLFANVLLEAGKPRLYYTVIGDPDGQCKVTVDFGGQQTQLSGVSGSMELSGPVGLSPLKVNCDCGASVSKNVLLPVKLGIKS